MIMFQKTKSKIKNSLDDSSVDGTEPGKGSDILRLDQQKLSRLTHMHAGMYTCTNPKKVIQELFNNTCNQGLRRRNEMEWGREKFEEVDSMNKLIESAILEYGTKKSIVIIARK